MNSKTTASAESTTSANSASTIDANSNDSSSGNTASNVIATPTTSNQTIPGSAVTSTTSLPNGSSASPTASGKIDNLFFDRAFIDSIVTLGSASLSSTGNETQSLLVSHGNIAGADNAEPHPALNDGCSACGIETITHQNSTSSNVQTGTPTQTTAESTKGAGNSTQDPTDIQIPATNTIGMSNIHEK